jgi:FMN reductase
MDASAPPLIVTITGSPSAGSRTAQLTESVAASLRLAGFEVQGINVRDLPADDLLAAKADSAPISQAIGLVERARGVVVSSPIYKASYSGVLKVFLDLLPQFGLGGKVVLPLMTGGTTAHVLAIDYALRPVLLTLGALHVVTGLFLLDKSVAHRIGGGVDLDPELQARLDRVLADFASSVRRHADLR